jgi:hypothetical protein
MYQSFYSLAEIKDENHFDKTLHKITIITLNVWHHPNANTGNHSESEYRGLLISCPFKGTNKNNRSHWV